MKTQFQHGVARAPGERTRPRVLSATPPSLTLSEDRAPERGVYAASSSARLKANRFTTYDRGLKRPEGRAPVAQTWKPAPPQQGVALVITLILLSVITFMTVTFLVISRHEGEQVDTTTQQNISKFAAEGILQQAEAQIISSIMGNRNGYNFGLMVSTNYVSPFFTNGISSISNINYYYADGTGLSQADQMTMLANLLYLPRVPVFITNKLLINNVLVPTNEFRFYLDENGNGMFDTNGFITNQDNTGQYIPNGSGGFVTSVQVGDPEWIGYLEHPDQRHSPSNFFLSRGAFIAVPIGNTLDINYIHNQAKRLGAASDGFLRNQGVGSWEINLAAFLHTLNTNWDSDVAPFVAPVFSGASYTYNTSGSLSSGVTSFTDAANILQYRYAGSYNQLNNFGALYPPNGQVSPGFLFGNYYIDGYAEGPLMTNVGPLLVPLPFSQPNASNWSGADNPIQIVRPRDLLTAIPNAGFPLNSFTNHLYLFGTNLDTYDRYTFYRMLAQMGVGSAPEPAPYPATRKINLNYANINGTNATSFQPWTALQFFTNAANRLVQTYYPTNFPITINGTVVQTNLNINFIPIYPTNYYTPSIHRLLQLAVNIYDASTNKANNTPDLFDYPSVFRPIYHKSGNGTNAFVYIAGYYEVSNNTAAYAGPVYDLRRVIGGTYDVDKLTSGFDYLNNIYGIPYVIGARKGFPAFDKFSFTPLVQITRQLQIVKPTATSPKAQWHINTQYVLGISNFMAVELWNSYTNAYPRNVRILATNDQSMFLTNNAGIPAYYIPNLVSNVLVNGNPPVVSAYSWAGTTATPTNYIRPILTGVQMITNSLVSLSPPQLIPVGTTTVTPITTTPNYYTPQWIMFTTNRVRLIMQDMPNGTTGAPGRLIDYVELSGMDAVDNINSELANLPVPAGVQNTALSPGWLWSPDTLTNNPNNPIPFGIYNQILIAAGFAGDPPGGNIWLNVQGGGNVPSAITKFYQFFAGNTNSGTVAQVPFSATAVYIMPRTYCVNDPLVHYLASDLTDPAAFQTNAPQTPNNTGWQTNIFSILPDINKISSRYRPWNNTGGLNGNLQPIKANHVAYADPQITQSSDWQFPTNKYPNVGWLGRVHRGTPWQTVYLKSAVGFNAIAWQYWTGNTNIWPGNTNNIPDSIASQPSSDWPLLDLFTAAPNDNASRGQLSVNQTNFAAWAAVLDGVMVLSNNPVTKTLTAMSIDTTQPGVQAIITGINQARANLTNQGQVFTSMGQVLSAPQLTVSSPYITQSDGDTNLTDAVYERIPQQIMGLLRTGSPRYAIYAYGQALKPAPNSIVQSGQFFGMCTNYQITGEVLTRTIVRFDNAQSVPGTLNTPQGAGIAPRAVVESYQILSPDQ